MNTPLIRVCIDPNCEAVFHNYPESSCADCNGRTIAINTTTYLQKFRSNFFQYLYANNELTLKKPHELKYPLQQQLFQ